MPPIRSANGTLRLGTATATSRVFAKYDIMTVGEADGVPLEEAAALYTDEENGKFNMIFQFDHMGLDSGIGGKWEVVPWKLGDFKQVVSKWQTGLHNKGWNTSYLENHDQPRSISRFGDGEKHRVESGKMLATFFLMLQGTPYIYQGQEIGMTNVVFDSIEDYRDVELLNLHRECLENGDEASAWQYIYNKGRDNSRTPMQWSDGPNAGFTTGTPWIRVNPNYKEINVEQMLQDSNSIYHYYKNLIQLRKDYDVLVYGDYQALLEEDERVFAYLRAAEDEDNSIEEKVVVVLNFFGEPATVTLPPELTESVRQRLIGNYVDDPWTVGAEFTLRPYEAAVYKV